MKHRNTTRLREQTPEEIALKRRRDGIWDRWEKQADEREAARKASSAPTATAKPRGNPRSTATS